MTSASSDMTTNSSGPTAPAYLLAGIFGLVLAVLALVAVARTTNVGASRLAEPVGGTTIDLRFEDGPGGSIRVIDVAGRLPDQVLVPGQEGFVRVALRSLARERLAAGLGREIPFRLGRLDDGRLWLRDLATDRLLYLDAYGHENARSFARLIGQQPRNP